MSTFQLYLKNLSLKIFPTRSQSLQCWAQEEHLMKAVSPRGKEEHTAGSAQTKGRTFIRENLKNKIRFRAKHTLF